MLREADIVPDFQVVDIHGAEISLETILSHGKALLAFFKVNCPTCKLTLPFFERLYKSTRIMQVYGISQDDAVSTKTFCQELELTFPILFDDSSANYPASNAFQIESVPAIFVVQKDNEIEWALEGFSRKVIEQLGHDLHVAVFRLDDQVPELKPG